MIREYTVSELRLLKACQEAEKVIFGSIGDLLTGDSMNDTGAYDVLDILRQAITKATGG